VLDTQGKPVQRAADVDNGAHLNLRFQDGTIAVQADGADGLEKLPQTDAAANKDKKIKARKPQNTSQGDLFWEQMTVMNTAQRSLRFWFLNYRIVTDVRLIQPDCEMLRAQKRIQANALYYHYI